ncbi:pilus assembly protein [Klebsiella variicola]|uniref:pilus assembly protein n=1 Tax=Klebsiella variicola TaxID=244366 RepID=UPI0035A25AD2
MITLLIVTAVVFLALMGFVVLSLTWPPLMRRTFWLSDRIRFWQMVRTLWRMGMKPQELFDTLEQMYSEDGKKRNRGSLLCRQLSGAVSKRTFGELGLPGDPTRIATPEDVLGLWCSPVEAVLYRVGAITGNMSDALAQSISLLGHLRQMREAMAPAIAQFSLLLLTFPGILWGVSEKMLPAMSGLIPPERWTVHIRLLDQLSQGIQAYGLLLAVAGVALLTLLVRSLPRRGGAVRRHLLDVLPPWSVYATLQGALFLLSAGALMKAGLKSREVLDVLRGHASPWLALRLDAAGFHVRSGRNLGAALYASGYRFPSLQSAIFLRSAGASRDIADVLHDWGETQMPVALSRIKSLSNGLTLGLGLLIAAFLIYVMFAVTGLTMTLSSQGL